MQFKPNESKAYARRSSSAHMRVAFTLMDMKRWKCLMHSTQTRGNSFSPPQTGSLGFFFLLFMYSNETTGSIG